MSQNNNNNNNSDQVEAASPDIGKYKELFQQAATMIDEADALIILTGAGMGVGSGLGTFRGKNAGIWPPLERMGLSFPELSNPTWFQKDPHLGWSFWYWRYTAYTGTKPHSGYYILKNMVDQRPLKGFSATSNIDGHWVDCGFGEDRILEVHGTLRYLQCESECDSHGGTLWETPKLNLTIKADDRVEDPLPKCKVCNELARPAVLMFGDWGWCSARTDVQENNYSNYLKTLTGKKIVALEVGAGKAVPTIRRMTEDLANDFSTCSVIRINPEQPELEGLQGIALDLNAEIALNEINKLLKTPVRTE